MLRHAANAHRKYDIAKLKTDEKSMHEDDDAVGLLAYDTQEWDRCVIQ